VRSRCRRENRTDNKSVDKASGIIDIGFKPNGGGGGGEVPGLAARSRTADRGRGRPSCIAFQHHSSRCVAVWWFPFISVPIWRE